MEYTRCKTCPYYSLSTGCTASFYERVQSNCQKHSADIKHYITQLNDLQYISDVNEREAKAIEINEHLEALVEDD